MQSVFERSNLTNSQFLIWMGQALRPETPLYNMALSFEIRIQLDVERFSRAFQTVVLHAECLRTTFEERGGVPWRIVKEDGDSIPEFVDLSSLDGRDSRYAQWLEDETGRQFDLGDKLYHCAIIKITEDRWCWYLNVHHLVTDAWSHALIYRSVSDEYGRLADDDGGGDSSHADGSVGAALQPFEAYVAYERNLRDTPRWSRSVAYWSDQVSTAPTITTFYGAPSNAGSSCTRRTTRILEHSTGAAIQAFIREPRWRALTDDLARFHFICTVLVSCLYRATGERRLGFLAPNHNRPTAAFKATPGLFIEIFPIQAEVEEGESFLTLYDKVKKDSIRMFTHALPGSSHIVHQHPWRVLLNMITTTYPEFDNVPAETTWMHSGHGDAAHVFRLQVHKFTDDSPWGFHFDLNEDVFDSGKQTLLADDFMHLLDAMLNEPEQAIDKIALPSDTLTQRLSTAVPDEAGALPPAPALSNASVIDAFDNVAGSIGNATAVRCKGESVSYATLWSRSHAIACELADCGVSEGSRVGVVLPRSVDLVASLLAVLRVGAAYVPIDTRYPESRIDAMLLQANVSAVLATEQGDFSCSSPVICVDNVALTERHCAPVQPRPERPAYVMFTSGSTGEPKGVVISNAALAHYVQWAKQQYCGDEKLRFALYSSISFDLTVTSVFVPMVSGGSIEVYPDADESRDLSILDVYRHDAVDVLKLTPSHLALLREVDNVPRALRCLIVGGEDFKTDLAASAQELLGSSTAIWNEYGPTEATVGAMIYRFNAAERDVKSVPIGQAVSHAVVYVLNESMRQVTDKSIGEIYIGGASLADGYFGRDDLSADRFVENPFGRGRLYRTGDLARWLGPNRLEYCGRTDDQVKIGGARLELGEVEGVLTQYEAIKHCAVSAITISNAHQSDERFCSECGLSSRHPDAEMDNGDVCALCLGFHEYEALASAYFGTRSELVKIAEAVKQANPLSESRKQDCMVLLSGGKDSTYALYQVIELGLNPLVFSLDNGFISDGAKANIRRVTDDLGLELVWGSSPAMNEVFRDSLARFSNVCQGCFKVIYTLSTQLAKARGLSTIFTGLSRGQIYETRIADMFHNRIFDREAIDQAIVEARRIYHRMDDAVSRNLDVRVFEDDQVFEEIKYVDVYRYCEVSLDDIYGFLDANAPWVRPDDTGRSTNCLINEAGIFVHRAERGYHNYALPYSWDVRLGHKERDAALAELNDEIDPTRIRDKLNDVGYDERLNQADAGAKVIVAYYVADSELAEKSLVQYCRERLPHYAVPAKFIRLSELPLTGNAKVDRSALPVPDKSVLFDSVDGIEPTTPTELRIAGTWTDVMGLSEPKADQDFFESGGDSLLATQLVTALRERGLPVNPQDIFRWPTISGLAAFVDEQSMNVASTNLKQLTNAVEGFTDSGNDEGLANEYPLSPIQAGMLFHVLERPTAGIYFEQYSTDIAGDFNPAAFEAAWRDVVNHHATLRTAFVWGESAEPTQRISDRVEVPWRTDDWRSMPATEQIHALKAFLVDDRKAGFDTSRAPLLRFFLVQTSDRGWRFVWSYSHLISDGWSREIIFKDLWRYYERHTTQLGSSSTSVDVDKSYQRFVSWLSEQDPSAAKTYWRSTLYGFDGVNAIRLPTAARSTKRGRGLAEGRFDWQLSEALSERIRGLARECRVTPSTIVLGAWAQLLSRFGRNRDVLFGVTVSGRPSSLQGADRAVGPYLNTLPLAVHVDERQPLSDWLVSVQEELSDARRFEWSPLAQVRTWAEAPPRQDLFETIVVFQNTLMDAERGHPEEITLSNVEYLAWSNYPLAVIVEPTKAFGISMVYDTEHFDDTVIETIAQAYEATLSGMTSGGAQTLHQIPMLSASHKQLLGRWSDGSALSEPPTLVLDQFLARAASDPHAPAVRQGKQEWSYSVLDEWSSRLAQRLNALGGAGDCIGIRLERSPEMIGVLLAAWKCGASYVPLDTDWPDSRLASVLDAIAPRILVTDTNPPSACFREGCHILELSLEAEPVADEILEELPARPAEQDVAYVMFTSGTSGAPKGVSITHRNLAWSVRARHDYYQESVGAYFLLSSLAFDSSVAGIYWALTQGGVLEIPRAKYFADPSYLCETIKTRQLTHLLAIPALYQALLDENPASLASLRVAIVAGEACPHALIAAHTNALPLCQLHNEYGPTEGTVWATATALTPRDDRRVSIGHPIPGASVRVEARDGSLLPVGIPGELVLGGQGVSPGYWNDAPRSAAAFVERIHHGQESRWYRTGDIVRWLSNGELEYLFRDDEQVKIRGHRIEVAEVEEALSLIDDVQNAVVLARPPAPNLDQLVEMLMQLDPDEAAALIDDCLASEG